VRGDRRSAEHFREVAVALRSAVQILHRCDVWRVEETARREVRAVCRDAVLGACRGAAGIPADLSRENCLS
jgi:hypothetical protein